jgi:acyl-CoA synthetase (AMP-forming)/AMP-acid ligase II
MNGAPAAALAFSPEITLSGAIAANARHRPTEVAVVCGDRRVRWVELDERINRVANALVSLGIARGDKVALLAPNCIEAVEVLFGAMRAGGVAVPLPLMAHPDHLAQLIADSDAKVLFSAAPALGARRAETTARAPRVIALPPDPGSGYDELLRDASPSPPPVVLSPGDDCNIIYSSGTTGVPKGIVHTHASRAMFTFALRLMFRIDQTAITLVTTPLYTNGTWMTLLPTIASGGTTVLMEAFGARALLDIVQRERCTHAFMVPTQLTMVLDEPTFDAHDLSCLRIVISAAAPLRIDTKREILRRMTRGLMELYGMTEGIGTVLQPEDMERKIASVGQPIPGTEIRIIDDGGKELGPGEIGEIVGSSPGVMRGYYKKPTESEALLWKDLSGRPFLRTGDIGKKDEEGYVYILDRKKDMILTGGINVYASDLEEAFSRHPDVAEAAVIAIPHDKWGETPLVFVVPRPGARADAEEIREWGNERLGKHQRASRVEVREGLPRNALGKVLKRELRDAYWPK